MGRAGDILAEALLPGAPLGRAAFWAVIPFAVALPFSAALLVVYRGPIVGDGGFRDVILVVALAVPAVAMISRRLVDAGEDPCKGLRAVGLLAGWLAMFWGAKFFYLALFMSPFYLIAAAYTAGGTALGVLVGTITLVLVLIGSILYALPLLLLPFIALSSIGRVIGLTLLPSRQRRRTVTFSGFKP